MQATLALESPFSLFLLQLLRCGVWASAHSILLALGILILLYSQMLVVAPQGRAKPLSVFCLPPPHIPSSTKQVVELLDCSLPFTYENTATSQYRDENRGPQRGNDLPKVTH